MSLYLGPNPGIASGNPLSSAEVEDSFDRFATAVSEVSSTNLSSEKVITYRSVHPGSLTETFREGQLLYEEPAAWLSLGRGGTSTPATRYSLGPKENDYTVDGCSVRAVVNGDGRVKVNSFIQIESIKAADRIDDPAEATRYNRLLISMDLDITFKLKYMVAGETHSSATTLDTVVKRLKVPTTNHTTFDYGETLKLRRGFTVELSDDVTLSGVDSNGSAYDFFVTIEPTIPAAKAVDTGGGTLSDVVTANGFNDYLFLAHLRSYSRYTTARVFLK